MSMSQRKIFFVERANCFFYFSKSVITLFVLCAGYLMCIFQEKLDDSLLENLQDFEFAVCHWFTSSSYICLSATGDRILIWTAHLLWNIQFSDEDGDSKKFFYRTSKTRLLDNLLGDLYHKILGMQAKTITSSLILCLMTGTSLGYI